MKRQPVVPILYLLAGGGSIAIAVFSAIFGLSGQGGRAFVLTAIFAPLAVYCLCKARRSAVILRVVGSAITGSSE